MEDGTQGPPTIRVQYSDMTINSNGRMSRYDLKYPKKSIICNDFMDWISDHLEEQPTLQFCAGMIISKK